MFVIFDVRSRQWVGRVNNTWQLVSERYLAHEFATEVHAAKVRDEFFPDPLFQFQVKEVQAAP
jgi:hypothetical protein